METDLIKQLQSGSEQAFATCVEMYQDKVLNTCYHFLHDRLDAQDVAQDVFVEVYRSVKSFRKDAQLSTWIYRIAVNKSLDFIRRKNRKKRFGQLVSIFSEDKEEPIPQLRDDLDPHTHMELQERTAVLNAAINILPENQKTAITLSKYEGLSNKEIADILATSVSSVEALLHRARKNLHKKLYHYYEKNL